MMLTILGSAAAEAVPALWCECDVCAYARKHGGKDLRKRTAYLLDEDTLIDFGPDAFFQVVTHGIDLLKIDRICYTHAHCDHCNPVELNWRRKGFSKVTKQIEILGSKPTYDYIKLITKLDDNAPIDKYFFDFRECSPGSVTTSGNLNVLAIGANHAPELDALNYILSRDGRKLLIANDTGFWSPASWQIAEGQQVDCAVIDTTMALVFAGHDQGHMGVEAVVRFRDELARRGALASHAKVIANHFSHNGNSLHHELEAFFRPHGIEVGFDGMKIEM